MSWSCHLCPVLIPDEPIGNVDQFDGRCLEVVSIRSWYWDVSIAKQQCCDGKRPPVLPWHSFRHIGDGTKRGDGFGYCDGRSNTLCLCSVLHPPEANSRALGSYSFPFKPEVCILSRRNIGWRCCHDFTAPKQKGGNRGRMRGF